MKKSCQVIAGLFGTVGIVHLLAALGPLLMDIADILNPNITLIEPTPSEAFMNGMENLSSSAIPMIAALLFWYIPQISLKESKEK